MIFPNRQVGTLVGVAFLVAGWVCLHDVYARRNTKMPIVLRPFYPWS